MPILEGKTYQVLETTDDYKKGEKFIVLQHDLTNATYWVAVDDYAPHWEEADVIENLKLLEVWKGDYGI